MTEQALTDKLLEEKIFTCAICENLLNIPITLVQDIGNICDECCKQNNRSGLPNIKLEMILKQLKIPCKFRTTGCHERIPYENLSDHESNCKFHEKPCLMSHTGCPWKGIQSNFPSHFIESHSDHVLTPQNNLYVVELDIEEPTNVIKFLKGKQECMIKIKKDEENDTLLYTVCDIKNPEGHYGCVIKHLGQNSNCVETNCKVSSLNNIQATKVNLTALKTMTEAANKITIQIKFATNETKEFDEKVLQYFECPVCKCLMRPPIYQCKFGHSFCNSCRPKLEKCPTCRALFGTTRNYSLEGLTSGISYSCMYQHLGCEETLQANDSDKHEAICPYKPHPCPLVDDCSFIGTHSNIGKHLNEKHKERVIPSDFYKTTAEFRIEQMIDFYNFQQKYYMVFDENIFRLSFKRNSDYSFWAVEVLRKKHEDSVFIYDIGIIDMRKPDRKLIRCDLCFTDTNTEELFKKCILFPNNILASYACNGMFTYYCQIRKR